MAYIQYLSGTFVPTYEGASTAGTTVYNAQGGIYVRIGQLVYINMFVNIASATGTGAIVVGGFPFTITSGAIPPIGAIEFSSFGFSWDAGTNYLCLAGITNSKTANINESGDNAALRNLPIQNVNINFSASLTYVTSDI